MKKIQNLADIDLAGQRVLIRQDLNVPVANGEVTSDARIRASLPGIQFALERGARVLLMSHLGRPVEGKFDPQFSLAPVAERLAGLLQRKVRLVNDYCEKSIEPQAGELVLLENVRFNHGETTDNAELARCYSRLCDIFVMDAFGTAHRAHASTHGVGLIASKVCAGPLLAAELDALGQAFENPVRPVVAIVGGSKVSTKLTVLESLSGFADQLIVGGGIANTFVAASGHEVGQSLYEEVLKSQARTLMANTKAKGGEIPLPSDVITSREYSQEARGEIKALGAIRESDMIFDIGPETASRYADIIKNAGTVLWNGPVGVFEIDQFGSGTRIVGEAIAESKAFSVAGGGDTLAAIDKYGLEDRISYISTGGGAFLEFLEGKKLPAVEMLEQASNRV